MKQDPVKNLSVVLQRLSYEDTQTCLHRIDTLYTHQHFLSISFLYFAQISLYNVTGSLDHPYTDALMHTDFLLPDGIALQLVYWLMVRRGLIMSPSSRLPNHNGTDFTPALLHYFYKKYANKMSIILYGGTADVLGRATNYLKNVGYNVLYGQDGYSVFDWHQVESTPIDAIQIMLIARGAPRQELWVQENMGAIKQKKLMVMCVGGLFDFWSGEEKRSPKIVRYCKLERVYRLLQNPRKNYKKVVHSFSFIWWVIKIICTYKKKVE